MRRLFSVLAIVAAVATVFPVGMSAQPAAAEGAVGKGASGLPLPRFVSLKAKRVNLRVGPGRDYAVSWLYTRAGVPMEVIQEYDNWRRVRDADGTEGWVYQSLLSGERTAVAAPWAKAEERLIVMRAKPGDREPVRAKLEPGVIITMHECTGEWCEAEAGGIAGWVQQVDVWGAYPGEAFK